MNHTDALRRILSTQLGPSYPPEHFQRETALLGFIPELDSMAVVGILTAVEEELGIQLADDDISAAVFESFGTFESFVEEHLRAD